VNNVDLIGLFPSSGPSGVGGVQASGRDAWNGILGRLGRERVHAFRCSGSSKAAIIVRALANRRRARAALVWHLNLLKLVPLLDRTVSRVVVFLHGIEAWRRQDPVTHLLLEKVDLFLSNSEFTWTRFVECNPSFAAAPHRTVHLGCGSPVCGQTPALSTVPIVLMVGRLDRREDYKGHREVIEAWPRVLEQVPGAQLWIVGDGDLEPVLHGVAREHDVASSIRFYGRVTDAEKQRLLAQSRCLAMPSRGEGFGLVYLEAMRLGRPCLVSNVDAGREVVNPPEAGLAVSPDDRAEMASTIVRLLTAGAEWREWSSRARARYESRFTGEHFQQRLHTALFESL